MSMLTERDQHTPRELITYKDDAIKPHTMPENDVCIDNCNVSLTDSLIKAEVLLHQAEADDGPFGKARVICHVTDENGNIIGQAKKKRNLNTLLCEVELMDGEYVQYTANVIAQEIYSFVDPEGHHDIIIEEIVDYAKDSKYTVKKGDEFFYNKGRNHRRRTTAGWKVLTWCKDGSEQWIPLKDLKASYLVQVSLLSKARGMLEKSAFAWWTPYVLKKAERIISKVKTSLKEATHKYGIEIPKNTKLKKDMKKVSIAFNILDLGGKSPLVILNHLVIWFLIWKWISQERHDG